MQSRKITLLKHRLADPFIWFLIIPFLVLDFFVELYHHTGFRLYGISMVKRSEYIKVDRHKLKHLSLSRKIACTYCGYTNGFLSYASEIAARTESYWCAIKHEKKDNFKEPKHHSGFVEHNDKEAYRKRYPKDRSPE